MAFFDLAVKTALDALGKSHITEAQKVHIDFLKDKFESAEKEIAKLTAENLQLLRETKQPNK